MALACQRDSYLKEMTTTVISCQPAQISMVRDGRKVKVECHEVVLDDTVLFPEGGGQPDDRGKIGNAEVIKVERKGTTAVHFTLGEVTPGSEVSLEVDWKRRFDHMQQHTAQHLITAVADSLFGFKTTSWSLGEQVVTIELDTPAVSKQQEEEVERVVNEKIRQQLPVTLRLFPDKADPQLMQYRTRGLPADHQGPVRMLDIEGVDMSLCCGTHVSNLSHLQAVKVLGCEGRKGRTGLLFVAGQRLLDYMGRARTAEKRLTAVLKGPLDQQADLAEKAVKGFKSCQKVCQAALKDLALLEAERYRALKDKGPVFCHFRKDGDADYMNLLVTQVLEAHPGVVCLVSVGDDREAGLITLAGPDSVVRTLGPQLGEVLEGRGAVTGGRYRAKVARMANRGRAERLLTEHVASHPDC